MKVYLGQTRAAKWIATLAAYGFGECTSRGEFPPRRFPWFMDNGAFGDWLKQRPFQVAKYERDLAKLRTSSLRPDFMVVPDEVAKGAESLAFSLSWVERLREFNTPLYLVLQDGMTEADVHGVALKFDGLFVGGSLPWKLKTSPDWVRFAHSLHMPCHIGRVGTELRVRWAKRIQADSIDSSLPLWAEANFRRFLKGFQPTHSYEFGFARAS